MCPTTAPSVSPVLPSSQRMTFAEERQEAVGGWYITMFHVPIIFSAVTKRLMSSTVKQPVVVFVLGGPGAGKGTQCEKIEEEFGYIHRSAGDLLRQERASPGSRYGDLIEKHMREGTIVPVEITISLIEKAMEESPVKKFLIDGFPRNEDNLTGWRKQMDGKVKVACVLFFDCPEDECIRRIMERAKTSGRTDDNIDSLRKRFQTHANHTMPIVQYYENLGLVRKIPADLPTDEVFEKVKEVFKDLK